MPGSPKTEEIKSFLCEKFTSNTNIVITAQLLYKMLGSNSFENTFLSVIAELSSSFPSANMILSQPKIWFIVSRSNNNILFPSPKRYAEAAEKVK